MSSAAVSLLTLNADLFPWWWRWNPILWGGRHATQRVAERAGHVAALVAQHDIIVLQGVWTPYARQIHNAVRDTHDMAIFREEQQRDSTALSFVGMAVINPGILSDWCSLACYWRRDLYNQSSVMQHAIATRLSPQTALSGMPAQSRAVVLESTRDMQRLVLVTALVPRLLLPAYTDVFQCILHVLARALWPCCVAHLIGDCACYRAQAATPKPVEPYMRGRPITLDCCSVVLAGDLGVDPYHERDLYDHVVQGRLPVPPHNSGTVPTVSAAFRDMFEEDHNPRYAQQTTWFSVEPSSRQGLGATVHVRSRTDPKERYAVVSTSGGNALFHWDFHGRPDHILAVERVTLHPRLLLSQDLSQRQPEPHTDAEGVKRMQLMRTHLPDPTDPHLIVILPRAPNSLETTIQTQPYGSELASHWPLVAVFNGRTEEEP